LTWLLEGDPAVCALARRELLGEQVPPESALASPVVRGLLSDVPVGSPYAKWRGAHWRLVSLVELGVTGSEPRAVAACDAVLGYWARPRRLAQVQVIGGRARRCASQEGNAVAVACRLGLAGDDRVGRLVDGLLEWQWPDGGWNCDTRPEARHSSFHETLPALWGLHEFASLTGETDCRAAVLAATELLLEHEVVFSARTGQPIHPLFVEPHYPPYWHYDVLQALLVLHRAGFGKDPRADRARQLVSARRSDGTWHTARRWWRPPGSAGGGVEAVDWRDVANQMVTLNALRVGAGSLGP
jgi:hypothetical protein